MSARWFRLLASAAVVAVLVGATAAAVAFPGSAAPAPQVAPGATDALPAVAPPLAPVSLPVCQGPNSVLVVPTNGTAYVGCRDGNVSAISLTTGSVLGTFPVGVFPAPQGLAFDPVNWTVVVVNSGSDNLSLIPAGGLGVNVWIHVGSNPRELGVDPGNGYIYVANNGSRNVSLVSPVTNTILLTLAVGANPDAVAVDTANHNVFVADAGSGNVSVVSGTGHTLIGTIQVGSVPGQYGSMAFDAQNGKVYVANYGSNNVSVLNGTNGTVNATIPVGLGPNALAVDPIDKEVFVANSIAGTVSVISTATESVVATLPVGSGPSALGGIAFDPVSRNVYVPNFASDSVSVLSAKKNAVVATLPVGVQPSAVGVDPTTGRVFVANLGSGNVTSFALTPVTFREVGLPPGSTWSVSASPPSVALSNTTSGATGTISFLAYEGALSYAVAPPANYGVALVTGMGSPSQTSVNVSGVTKVVVHFGPLEKVWFNETGLVAPVPWTVNLTPSRGGAGPPATSVTTNGSSLNFTEPAGAKFHFTLTAPSIYRTHSKGTFGVPASSLTKNVAFKLLTVMFYFPESGLPGGTSWSVQVVGTDAAGDLWNTTVSGTAGHSIPKIRLPNGTYTFTVLPVAGHNPGPGSGTLAPVYPSAPQTVGIIWT